MSKSLKVGVIFLLVGLPSLTYILLKIFGTNQFDLPYLFPIVEESGEVKMLKGDTVFNTVQPFKLIDQNKKTVDLPQDKITVVNFFFTRCGTICPIINSNLVHVADVFKNEQDVNFIGISVDPNFDTPEVLKAYSRKLGIEDRNYKLLTGDKAYIYNLCIKNFKLPVADASEYDPAVTHVDEMFIHSDKVLLIDPKGYFRGIYEGTSTEDIDRLKVEIKVLLNQTKNGEVTK